MNEFPFELQDFDPEVDRLSSVVIAPVLDATDRSVARRACLQVLYELDATEHTLSQALDAHLDVRPESYAVRQIIRRILAGVLEHRERIDALIGVYAPEFPVDQIAIIDRNILRIALFEHFVQSRVTPVPVIINESVRLAQLFGAQNAPGFVHGVLGAITSDESITLPLDIAAEAQAL